MLCLTRRYPFSAAHRLWNPDLSADQNEASFGPCIHLHGHNYILEVTISGIPDPQTGMIINLMTLDKIVRDTLIVHVDHRYLDQDVDFLAGTLSTVENVVSVFYDKLVECIPSSTGLYRMRLYESETNWAEMTCEEKVKS